MLPAGDFAAPNPTQVADLSGTQQGAIDLFNRNLEGTNVPLEESEIVKSANTFFESQVAPGIENRATLSGLGRSTALENARASAQATSLTPLLQGEQARRDAFVGEGLRVGDVERSVEQQRFNAEANDALRRQALSEQALFGPLSQLPSTFGSTTKTSTSGGGGGFLK